MLVIFASVSYCIHFEIAVPYSGEIFDSSDTFFQFVLHGADLPKDGEIVMFINGAVATRSSTNENIIRAPSTHPLPAIP